ncbi:plasmid mobilization relaxosome protein MobC, partial [Verminephrobacter eiseniae]|uniref:plasmid mobilization relaxosome protein MobC n=1 Tax=Verminephrobacter eiseniae TaxID=364317 RepID=UPI002244662B
GHALKPIRNDMRWVGRCQYHEGEGWVQLAWWPDLLPSLVGLKLAKVGTNLNQVAKAFNTLVKMRGGG